MVHRIDTKVLAFLFAALLLFSAPSSGKTVTVVDKLGRRVEVEVPVKRAIIVISYELIPALNIWDQVVGVSRWADEICSVYKAFYSLNPLLRKPVIGTGSDISVENVLKLRPDVLITWTVNENIISFIQSKGIKVIGIYPENLNELVSDIKMHGLLFGKEERSEEVVKIMNEFLSRISTRINKVPHPQRKKVVHLGSSPTRVSGGIGVTNEMLALAGGINVAGHIKQRSVDVSIEKLIEWNPDVIFIWGSARYDRESILTNPQWRSIKAVREGKVYKLPRWSTWSPRLAPNVLYIAVRIYPELFKDINFEDVTDGFYRAVFGLPYKIISVHESN
ncbi:MAG: ABC transporter substrate-binding protein [Deltaproteobacteria bacterium]|nr:ABC transporter substrate-binding protein [Deltaproteobacteria bacterium]